MPLETATYISELVTNNPAHTDGLSQADSHARLTKATIKATFPNFTAAALTSTQAQLDAAVANVVTGTAAGRFFAGTAALPGLTPIGDTNTGLWSPAADQLAFSLNGVQTWLMGGSAIVTTLGFTAAAIATAGAYSGGTGQLVPIGATLIWWDDVLPTEGGYAWANGQIIASANTVCPILLARWGTRFGGNGTTTMGVPDLRDTVPVGKSTMGAVASRGILGAWGNTVLGTLIGAVNKVLTQANLPNVNFSVTGSGTATPASGGFLNPSTGSWSASAPGGGSVVAMLSGAVTYLASAVVAITGTAASGGSGTAVDAVQPATTCNYIIRLA